MQMFRIGNLELQNWKNHSKNKTPQDWKLGGVKPSGILTGPEDMKAFLSYHYWPCQSTVTDV